MRNLIIAIALLLVSAAIVSLYQANAQDCPGMSAYMLDEAGQCIDLSRLEAGDEEAGDEEASNNNDNEIEPIRVIFDTDGAFEDYYALLTLALASQLDDPPVKLIGVTTMAHGEAYCNNSNGYPDLKQTLLADFSVEEGTIDGITQKVLSIAAYDGAKIYSGCDESTAIIDVPNEVDDFGKPIPGSGLTQIRTQLPLAGLDALEPCLFHQEFVFSEPDVVCWNEFNRAFRDETLRFVLPQAQAALDEFELPELDLIEPWKKASAFLAASICKAYRKDNPLTIVTVGPATNLGRAYVNLEKNPSQYGCPSDIRLSDLKSVIATRHMGGAWDEDKSDNFDDDGNYRLNEPFPVWTLGNIYFQAGEHIFGMHHLPFPGTNFQDIQTGEHKQAFNSLNNAEFNFWVDALAVDQVLNSGIPMSIVPLNVTDRVRLEGLADRIQDNPAVCATASAQFIKNLQFANEPEPGVFVFDTLFLWDTLTVTSLWNNFVNFEDFSDLEITTLTNGDLNTVTGQLSAKELFRRDIGNLFRLGRVDNPVSLGLSVNPDRGDPDLSTTLQNLVFDLVCTSSSDNNDSEIE
ncbi:MAG: nucleoside hydrolase [Pseudanabaenales cyanobacterium]|nr:nucleoside hydrolase [Pseudanabaenales cyanobacterium]